MWILVGGFFGGNELVPMLGGVEPAQGAINAFALVMAATCAAAVCL